MSQLDLFAPTPSARATDPATSHTAATLNPAKRSGHRDLVLETIGLLGEVTDCQVSTYTGLLRGSAAKRRGELVELGLVHRVGRGRTDTGSPAFTWALTPAGIARFELLRNEGAR